MTPNGVILYRGPSRIDGAPIVVVATGLRSRSENSKTGGMVQTWILRDDMAPLDALKSGADASICGGCRHRPDRNGKRSCYVNVGQAPTSVYRALQRGRYPAPPASSFPALFAGRVVRLGAYGDPAAVPLAVWQLVTRDAAGHTGYTHQWKSARLRDVTALCQASVDTPAEADKADALRLAYFRVKAAHESARPGEVVCPASAEAGKVTTCAECRMCDGTDKRIVINAHGSGAVYVARRALPTLPS